MAGHSHSANIKFRKARVDAQRSKLFSKLARMITVAAKLGGADPDANPRLRLAIEKARVVSMPKDNIERAIKKGTGDLEGSSYEEILYEGYGPGGVAVMLEVLTDNRHRTAPEVRKIFERVGGNLGASGAVAWMFERKALFVVSADGVDEDRLLEAVLDAGAEDMTRSGDLFEVKGEPGSFLPIKAGLEAAGCKIEDASVGYTPTTKSEVADVEVARKILKLMEALDEHDDVQNTFANYELTDDVAAQLAAQP